MHNVVSQQQHQNLDVFGRLDLSKELDPSSPPNMPKLPIYAYGGLMTDHKIWLTVLVVAMFTHHQLLFCGVEVSCCPLCNANHHARVFSPSFLLSLISCHVCERCLAVKLANVFSSLALSFERQICADIIIQNELLLLLFQHTKVDCCSGDWFYQGCPQGRM